MLLVEILIEVYAVSYLEGLWEKFHSYLKLMLLCLSHLDKVHLVVQL